MFYSVWSRLVNSNNKVDSHKDLSLNDRCEIIEVTLIFIMSFPSYNLYLYQRMVFETKYFLFSRDPDGDECLRIF